MICGGGIGAGGGIGIGLNLGGAIAESGDRVPRRARAGVAGQFLAGIPLVAAVADFHLWNFVGGGTMLRCGGKCLTPMWKIFWLI